MTTPPRAPIAAAPCLTHHQILGLIEPFARRGYRLDMAGSDRLQRRLRFVSAAGVNASQAPRESLLLESSGEGEFRLTRSAQIGGAPPALLQCEGDEVALLLQSVQAVDAWRQIVHGDGYLVVWHLHLRPAGRSVVSGAVAQLPGVTMTMDTPHKVTGRAKVDIRSHAGRLNLPDDLFAVLGRHWSLLQRDGTVWRFTMRARAGNAEQRFDRAVRHMQQALAQSPQRFHQQHWLARWGVSARRSMLMAAWASLLLLVAAAQPLWLARDSAWPLLLAAVPSALLWGCYQFAERPRLSWPRRPRAPDATQWLEPQP